MRKYKPGDRFGRVILIHHIRLSYWWCACDCGTEKSIRIDALVAGISVSCGCVGRERHTTHGQTRDRNYSPTYQSWRSMLDRCRQASHSHYAHYGGRGITVCERWQGPEGYANFLHDMGERPSERHSLDRKNNNGHYEPGNCTWSTNKEQNRNRSDNVFLTWQGRTQCLAAWAEELGIGVTTLRARKLRGLSDEEILTKSTDRWEGHIYKTPSKGRVCSNCGGDKEPFRKGRCNACSWYFGVRGVERPVSKVSA